MSSVTTGNQEQTQKIVAAAQKMKLTFNQPTGGNDEEQIRQYALPQYLFVNELAGPVDVDRNGFPPPRAAQDTVEKYFAEEGSLFHASRLTSFEDIQGANESQVVAGYHGMEQLGTKRTRDVVREGILSGAMPFLAAGMQQNLPSFSTSTSSSTAAQNGIPSASTSPESFLSATQSDVANKLVKFGETLVKKRKVARRSLHSGDSIPGSEKQQQSNDQEDAELRAAVSSSYFRDMLLWQRLESLQQCLGDDVEVKEEGDAVPPSEKGKAADEMIDMLVLENLVEEDFSFSSMPAVVNKENSGEEDEEPKGKKARKEESKPHDTGATTVSSGGGGGGALFNGASVVTKEQQTVFYNALAKLNSSSWDKQKEKQKKVQWQDQLEKEKKRILEDVKKAVPGGVPTDTQDSNCQTDSLVFERVGRSGWKPFSDYLPPSSSTGNPVTQGMMMNLKKRSSTAGDADNSNDDQHPLYNLEVLDPSESLDLYKKIRAGELGANEGVKQKEDGEDEGDATPPEVLLKQEEESSNISKHFAKVNVLSKIPIHSAVVHCGKSSQNMKQHLPSDAVGEEAAARDEGIPIGFDSIINYLQPPSFSGGEEEDAATTGMGAAFNNFISICSADSDPSNAVPARAFTLQISGGGRPSPSAAAAGGESEEEHRLVLKNYSNNGVFVVEQRKWSLDEVVWLGTLSKLKARPSILMVGGCSGVDKASQDGGNTISCSKPIFLRVRAAA